MKNLVLIGAGGHAKEVMALARSLNRNIIYCAEDKPIRNKEVNGVKVIPIDKLKNWRDSIDIIIAVGNPYGRRRLANRLKGYHFSTLIHKSAQIGPNVELGEGCVIAPKAIITTNSVIGNHTLINTGAIVSHDCKFGNFVTCSPNSTIGGDTILEDGSFISLGATVLNKVRVGNGSVLAAGSVLTKDLGEGLMAAGNPATVKKRLNSWPKNI